MEARWMRVNSDCTLYNRYLSSGAEAYQRTAISDVAWENRKAVNVLASGGNIAADQATIYIPYARGTFFLASKAWLALVSKTGKWTLQPGDVIVRGTVTDTISAGFTITALKAKYDDVLVISSVDLMNIGSRSMWHWRVGAK
jgi:hypothetical protein